MKRQTQVGKFQLIKIWCLSRRVSKLVRSVVCSVRSVLWKVQPFLWRSYKIQMSENIFLFCLNTFFAKILSQYYTSRCWCGRECMVTGMINWDNQLGWIVNYFNPIQDGGCDKPPLPPTANSFSPVTSTYVEICSQNFLLVLILLPHGCKISSSYLVPVANYWTWTKTTTTPQKNKFFCSNPDKIEVMITSLIQMLELPNFGHMTSSTI